MSLGFNQEHPDNHPRLPDRVCAVCARPASGFGVVVKYKSKILWCCGEPECFDIAARTYDMSTKDFTRLDSLAAIEGGSEAGAYLEEIGKSDLGVLEEAEWQEFCRRLVGGYRHALQETLRNVEPF